MLFVWSKWITEGNRYQISRLFAGKNMFSSPYLKHWITTLWKYVNGIDLWLGGFFSLFSSILRKEHSIWTRNYFILSSTIASIACYYFLWKKMLTNWFVAFLRLFCIKMTGRNEMCFLTDLNRLIQLKETMTIFCKHCAQNNTRASNSFSSKW